jgi:hypothetical protein
MPTCSFVPTTSSAAPTDSATRMGPASPEKYFSCHPSSGFTESNTAATASANCIAEGAPGRGGGWGLAPAGQSLLLIVAARFVQRLVDLIEGGYGLEEEVLQDAPTPAPSPDDRYT